MEQEYKNILLQNASRLDAIAECNGQITKLALSIVTTTDDAATIALCRAISDIINTNQNRQQCVEVAMAVKNSLIDFYGYNTISKICKGKEENNSSKPDKTLEELLGDLNQLVGLKNVKSKVFDLIAYQKVQKLRKDMGLAQSKNTLHLAFTGNPGTGKTTVARIVGRIYKQIGLLSQGHFIEVSRTDLIAGYQGQTALKVKDVITQAKGGVLFIDEAYSITENDHSDSYGRECLTELTKALEDYREDLVVIVAGYTEPMEKFFESNPGLKSRFNTFVEFDDYGAEELHSILLSICKQADYMLSADADKKIAEMFEEQIANKSEGFSNGRFVRNIFDDLVMIQARRVMNIQSPTIQELKDISLEDVNNLAKDKVY